jgi:hypothetical protein
LGGDLSGADLRQLIPSRRIGRRFSLKFRLPLAAKTLSGDVQRAIAMPTATGIPQCQAKGLYGFLRFFFSNTAKSR